MRQPETILTVPLVTSETRVIEELIVCTRTYPSFSWKRVNSIDSEIIILCFCKLYYWTVIELLKEQYFNADERVKKYNSASTFATQILNPLVYFFGILSYLNCCRTLCYNQDELLTSIRKCWLINFAMYKIKISWDV